MNARSAAIWLCVCAPCWAQPLPPAPGASAVGTASAAEPTQGRPEAKVQRSTVEDTGARVDELRVRGQTRRILVQPKIASAPAYEIGTSTDGRDTSQDRRSEGRSLWHLFSF